MVKRSDWERRVTIWKRLMNIWGCRIEWKLFLIQREEYVVSFPELPGCLTCADTLKQAAVNGEEAKEEWLIMLWKMGLKFPEPVSLDYSGQFKLRIRNLYIMLGSSCRKRRGISMNQLCLFADQKWYPLTPEVLSRQKWRDFYYPPSFSAKRPPVWIIL